MEDTGNYETLLDEDSIQGIPERREALRKAIDELLTQIENHKAERKQIDARDEKSYEALKKLDAAYARVSRGKRYTAKTNKQAIRRFWTDETYQWIERYLFEWARRQLQDGPKEIWGFRDLGENPISLVDVEKIMSHYPDTFVERKSEKPKQKYARRGMEWALTSPMNRFIGSCYRQPWDVEIAILKARSSRPLTFSERMHGMMEDAIQSFYAGKFSTVAHAFNDIYWKDFAIAFCYYRDRAEKLEAEAKAHRETQAISDKT